MGSECTVPSGRAGIRDFTSAFNAPDKIIMLLGIQLLLIWCPFFLLQIKASACRKHRPLDGLGFSFQVVCCVSGGGGGALPESIGIFAEAQ